MTIVLSSDEVGSQGQGTDPDIRMRELGPATRFRLKQLAKRNDKYLFPH